MVLSMPISHATAICSTVCLLVSCACWCYVSACPSMLVCSSPGMCLYVCLSLCLSFNVSYSMYVYPSLSDYFTLCQLVYLRLSLTLPVCFFVCVCCSLKVPLSDRLSFSTTPSDYLYSEFFSLYASL